MFALGLLVAVAAFIVALEYTSRPGSFDIDEQLLDELAEDMELLPMPDQRDMEAQAPPQEAPKPVAKIKPVDVVKEQAVPEKLVAEQPVMTSGDGEPLPESDNPAPAVAPVAIDDNNEVLSLRVVERLPEFPGGAVELMKWLTKNLRYPHYAKSLRIEGKVVVSFIINTDGTTSDPLIVQSAHAYLDEEAMRVVRAMPRWKPGENHGMPCRTLFAIPVVFKL